MACVAVLSLAAGCSRDDGANDQATSEPRVDVFSVGEPLPTAETVLLEVGTHCGVEVISASGSNWRTDEPGPVPNEDWIPVEWSEALAQRGGLLVLEVLLSEDQSILTASAGGRTVTYRPLTPEELPDFVCA